MFHYGPFSESHFPKKETAHPAAPNGSAFTLLELLVSVAILSLILVLLMQLLGVTNRTWKVGQQSLDNLSKSRAVLNLIAQDLQAGVFRKDTPAFVDADGNGASPPGNYTFYSMRSSGTDRNLVLINYRLLVSATASALQRGACPFHYADSNAISYSSGSIPQLANLTSDHYEEVGTGIIAFRIFFIHGDTYSLNYLDSNKQPAEAIGITLAVLDEKTQRLLQSQNKLQDLIASPVFNVPSRFQQSLKYSWEQAMKDQNFYAQPAIPREVTTGIRIFERIVFIPNNAK